MSEGLWVFWKGCTSASESAVHPGARKKGIRRSGGVCVCATVSGQPVSEGVVRRQEAWVSVRVHVNQRIGRKCVTVGDKCQ